MCGLAGILHLRDNRRIDSQVLQRMTNILLHRGPDEGGMFLGEGVGLGHRRLSIIDLATGQQPLFNEDGSVVVVFNGQIYNYRELTEELRAKGHIFRTNSDTETIVHAWEEWGEDCVERFRGMFSIALWDENKNCLFLARDRLGIKPLYYSEQSDGTILFGSELKSLLRYPEFERSLDPLAVEDYFAYGYVPDPRTIYQSATKLKPGHTICFTRGKASTAQKCYWDAPFSDGKQVNQNVGEELIERLNEAVKIRMNSEVPLGAFLSGGVDSSAIVAMMAQESDDAIDTCSISFAAADFDETKYAAMIAERYQTRHRVRQVNTDAFDLIDILGHAYDEPFADSSAMPTYNVCKVARENVTVALSGDGGDEIFAGYRRYKWHHYEETMRRFFPENFRRSVFGNLGRYYPKLDWAPRVFRGKTTFEALGRDSVAGYFHGVSITTDALRKALFSADLRSSLDGYNAVEVLRYHMERAPTEHHLSKVQYADMKTYLPGDILTKVDRVSMAHSLEVRVPLLDHEFLGWAGGLPAELKLKGSEGKYVFKKSLEDYLPHAVLYRPKMGFSVPLGAWFRGPLKTQVREALLGPNLAQSGLFNQNYLENLVDQHEAGARDHGTIMWALVMFETFLRQTDQPGMPELDHLPPLTSAVAETRNG